MCCASQCGCWSNNRIDTEDIIHNRTNGAIYFVLLCGVEKTVLVFFRDRSRHSSKAAHVAIGLGREKWL